MLGTKVLEITILNFQWSVEMFKLMSIPYLEHVRDIVVDS